MGKQGPTGRRCLAEGCARFVGKGHAVCKKHGRTREGREAEVAVTRLAQAAEGAFGAEAEAERRGKELERFRLTLARGDYAGLTDGGLRGAMAQAAAEIGRAHV